MRNTIISAILILLLFAIVFQFSKTTLSDKRKQIEEHKCLGFCTVIMCRNMKGNVIQAYAIIKGDTSFFECGAPFPDIVQGQKFMFGYNCENPDQKDIYYDQPLFTKEQDSSLKQGTVKRIEINENDVIFFYTDFKEKEHSKFQKIRLNKGIELTDYFVEYIKDDPRNAILKYKPR